MPPVGAERKHGLVLLIEFSDVSFTGENVGGYYDAFFNDDTFSQDGNYGSVRKYYKDQSEGLFDVDFDVCGPIVLSRSYVYYGQNAEDGFDLHPAEMMQEALDLLYADDESRDFSRYDWNGDGEVDMLFAIYAGRGENYVRSKTQLMWPHMFTFVEQKEMYDDGVGKKSIGGVYFNIYACTCELVGSSGTQKDGIGTACHEFMHGLGIPDTYGSSSAVGMGYYDLMAHGNYLNNGRTPCALAGFHRMLLGWADAEEISAECTVTAMAPLTEDAEIYVMYNTSYRNECYVIENRQQTSWDRYVPNAGLLLTHVDYDEEVWKTLLVNSDATHLRMSPVVQSLWTSLPLFNGEIETLPLGVEDVTQVGHYVSFNAKAQSTDINEIPHEDGATQTSERYDLMGRKIPSGHIPKGLYVEDGKLRLPSK